VNIAMWSGPRNLSTAMMRSFAQRADCRVWDEPFYAAYLVATGLDHPMRDEVIAAGLRDPNDVIAGCIRPPESGIVYQKHMAQHMIRGIDRGWIRKVTNVFLIREPARVIASYHAKREDPLMSDLGFVEQADLFDRAADAAGRAPLVVDALDIRADPRAMLDGLCGALGIGFDEAMLSWPAGPSPDDGVWGAHWYRAIWDTTGFAPPERGEPPALPAHLQSLADRAGPLYQRLAQHRLRARADP